MLYRQRLYISLLIYTIGAIAISSAYIYRIDPDGISYIGIAQKYALSNWHDAINPYWSPLCSWLIAFCSIMAAKMEWQNLLSPLGQLWIFKTISLTAGLFCIISTDRLLRLTQTSPFLQAVLLYGSVPIILFYALNYLTPDLLSAAFALVYFVCLFQIRYMMQRRWAILCALAGIGAYLAKSYFLPFILLHFTAWHIWLYYQCYIQKAITPSTVDMKCQIRQRYLSAMTVLCTGCSIWIGIISWHSGYFTINNAAAYNMRLYSPNMPNHLFLMLGLLPPANETAICAWENISPYIDRTWQPKNFADYRLGFKIIDNLKTLWKIAISKPFYLLVLLIAVLYVLYSVFFAKILEINQHIKIHQNSFFYVDNPSNQSQQIGIYVFTIILYISGYLPLMLEERYLIVVCLLMLPLAALLIEISTIRYKYAIPITIFAVLFLIKPYLLLLRACRYAEQPYYQIAEQLRSINVNGRIACKDGGFHATLYVGYYLSAKMYGETLPQLDNETLYKDCQKQNIDYLFDWSADEQLLAPFKPVAIGKMPLPLQVYALY